MGAKAVGHAYWQSQTLLEVRTELGAGKSEVGKNPVYLIGIRNAISEVTFLPKHLLLSTGLTQSLLSKHLATHLISLSTPHL
uniref:Uncharacterized protein n=1 Tax=Moorena producens (strain JHB) TaxID=1454205 RepID=A0A1D9G1K5_MOOP1